MLNESGNLESSNVNERECAFYSDTHAWHKMKKKTHQTVFSVVFVVGAHFYWCSIIIISSSNLLFILGGVSTTRSKWTKGRGHVVTQWDSLSLGPKHIF